MGIYIPGMELPECGYRTIEICYDADGYPMALADGGEAFDVIPTADVRPVVLCRDCIYDDKCFAQSILKEMSRIPFDKNRFFCADGERRDGGADG